MKRLAYVISDLGPHGTWKFINCLIKGYPDLAFLSYDMCIGPWKEVISTQDAEWEKTIAKTAEVFFLVINAGAALMVDKSSGAVEKVKISL